MTEIETKPTPVPSPITPEEFSRFAKAINLSGVCPFCGKHHWSIAEPPHGSDWGVPAHQHNGSVAMPPPNIPLLTLFCTTCFFVRSHALLLVRKWLDDPANKDKGK